MLRHGDQRRPHAGLRRAQHGTVVSQVELPAPVKAAVLCDALPYIRRFAGRTVVVKYGGNALMAVDGSAAPILPVTTGPDGREASGRETEARSEERRVRKEGRSRWS